VGDLPTALWGVPPLVSILAGLVVIYALLRVFGRKVDGEEAVNEAARERAASAAAR
jgi:hypothetical protein